MPTPLDNQKSRYLLAGVWNTFIGFLLFIIAFAFFGDKAHYLLLVTGSTALGILHTHFIQRRYVWRSSQNYKKEISKFSFVYTIQYLLNVIFLILGIEILKLKPVFAQITSIAILTVLTFLINKRWTFNYTQSI